ncbi:MAG: ABC transporter permease subunit [Acidobacteriota bacterium]
MRNALAIAGKELRSYFASPIGWVIVGLFSLIFGWFFDTYLEYFVKNSMQAQMGGGPMNINMSLIRPLFSNATVIILFVLPSITMRTYSEEKRSGTIELLLTSPITDWEIIIGKFLGAMGLYCAMLAATMVYMAVLFAYGHPEWKPLVAGYIGLVLMGGCFISMGLFISSLTKNQIIAGIGTFIAGLLFWVINWMGDNASPTTAAILSYLSITEHFDDFAKGVLDTKHLIFYLSFITFGLFLTSKSVDSERWRG